MKNKPIATLLFAGAALLAGNALYANGPQRHDRDGIDTAARIIHLVTQIIRPETTVVIRPVPAVVQTIPAVTQTVYTVSPGVTVRTVYAAPRVVYTQTVYAPPPSGRYYGPRAPRGEYRPQPGPGRR